MNYNFEDHDLYTGDKEYILKVRDLADEDKPREKLIKYGPEILSVAELLAILLNVGTKKEGVLQMTSRVLKEYGEKNIINQKNPKDLERDLDIPLTKACQIVACFELGRRFFEETRGGIATVRTPKQVFEYLKDMRDLPKEHLRGIYLNSRYQVIHNEVISIGSLTASVIHPREVFRPAIEYSAAALILAHNHPSGSIKPTQPDIEITNHLKKVGEMLGIDLLDHIIIAKNKFYSIMSNKKKKIK
jgi:DNA repair protein RadC